MKKASRGVMLRASSRDEGGPHARCTPGWVSVASVSTSACLTPARSFLQRLRFTERQSRYAPLADWSCYLGGP